MLSTYLDNVDRHLAIANLAFVNIHVLVVTGFLVIDTERAVVIKLRERDPQNVDGGAAKTSSHHQVFRRVLSHDRHELLVSA